MLNFLQFHGGGGGGGGQKNLIFSLHMFLIMSLAIDNIYNNAQFYI